METLAVILEKPGPLPKPVRTAAAIPRRGEVLINVKASSVNYHDYVTCALGLPGLAWPRVPFADASGVVVALGEDVGNVALGERVIPNFFPYWLDGPPTRDGIATVLGDQIDGALQTIMRVTAACLVPAPPHLSHAEAATLGCAGLTAWRALFVEAKVQPGATVVVQGTGGVSLFALGFAKLAGATVILTSSSEEKLARGAALGADHLINYRNNPAWESEVLRVTDGRGADIVVDVGGATTLAQSVAAARTGGHVACIGVLSGFAAEAFPFATIMMKNITLAGITVGSTRQLAEMCRAVTAHRYHPVLDKNFALEEAEGALAQLLAQRHFGKITLSVDVD